MQGQLFTQDFLLRGVLQSPPYLALDDDTFLAFKSQLKSLYAPFGKASRINEAQTESELASNAPPIRIAANCKPNCKPKKSLLEK